jgi:MoaA/NifB/PqqE/SkfB family radical SAM enzyme
MLADIVSQADDLGTGFFVIAGGEPLMRPEILDVASDHPNVLFLLLTNGTLLADDTIARLGRLRNVILLLSLEGGLPETDERRGQGTHERLTQAMSGLRREHAYFGCSVTLTRANYPTVLDESYIGDLIQKGIRFFLFLDYTPTDESTQHWVLSGEQREQVGTRLAALKKRHQALFVAVPWDELAVGGCLSAGRGFVHINASGDVEPCPFAPYSDANLRQMSLLDALRSPFLARLRDMPGLSTYSGEGCALWKNREDVQRVLAEVTAKPE